MPFYRVKVFKLSLNRPYFCLFHSRTNLLWKMSDTYASWCERLHVCFHLKLFIYYQRCQLFSRNKQKLITILQFIHQLCRTVKTLKIEIEKHSPSVLSAFLFASLLSSFASLRMRCVLKYLINFAKMHLRILVCELKQRLCLTFNRKLLVKDFPVVGSFRNPTRTKLKNCGRDLL